MADDSELFRKARLNAARMANGDPEKLRLWLDALALWPGQEDKHVFVEAPPRPTYG